MLSQRRQPPIFQRSERHAELATIANCPKFIETLQICRVPAGLPVLHMGRH